MQTSSAIVMALPNREKALNAIDLVVEVPIAFDSVKSNPKAAEACPMLGVSTSSEVLQTSTDN